MKTYKTIAMIAGIVLLVAGAAAAIYFNWSKISALLHTCPMSKARREELADYAD